MAGRTSSDRIPTSPRSRTTFPGRRCATASRRPPTLYATTDQINETLAAIETARTLNRPFFITLALSATHSPYHKPPNNLHTRDGLPLDDTPDKTLRRAYYEAMIEAMDTELGRLLRGVNLSTTTVIFVGDNGTPYETTASPYDPNHAKDRVYEQGVHVPMIVAGSGVAAPGRMVDGLVNTVDLYPTILRLAGIDPASVLPAGRKIDGVSILPYITSTTTAALRPWVYAEKFDLAWNQNWQRAIRDRRYKLIERASANSYWGWPAREFFDLQNDPYEKTNLLQRTLDRDRAQPARLPERGARPAARDAVRRAPEIVLPDWNPEKRPALSSSMDYFVSGLYCQEEGRKAVRSSSMAQDAQAHLAGDKNRRNFRRIS